MDVYFPVLSNRFLTPGKIGVGHSFPSMAALAAD
jgi:hypothetical protein